MADYRTLENKIRDIVARPWTKDPKTVHHKQQQIQKKIIDEEPDMLNNKAIGIPDSVIEAAKSIAKGKTEVDVNPQYKPDIKDPDDDDDKKVKKEELKGKQHKIDKNKNGKIDAHDFKLLRKEDVELDEADSYSIRNTESDTDKIYHISKYPITSNHSIYKKIKAKDPKAQIHKNGQPVKEEVEQIDEKEVIFTGSPQHTAKKAAEHKKMGYKVVSMKKHTSGSFGDNSEKHTYKMAKEEVEQVDEISDTTLKSYRTKAMQHRMGHEPGDSAEVKADRNRKTRNRSQGVRTSYNKMIGRYVKVGGNNKKTYEEVEVTEADDAVAKQIAAKKDAMQKQIQQKIAQKQMSAMQAKANKRLSSINASSHDDKEMKKGGKEQIVINPPLKEASDLPKSVVSKGHEIAKSLIKHKAKVREPYAVGVAQAKKSAGIKD